MGTMEKLKAYRENAQPTQEAVEMATGFKKRTISNWENGVSRPDIESLAVLLRLYNVEPNSFYDWCNAYKEKVDNLTTEEIQEMERYKQFLISKREK